MTKKVSLCFFLFLCLFGHAKFSVAAASYMNDFLRNGAGLAVHDADCAHTKFFIIKPMGKGIIKRAYRKNTYSLRTEVAHNINDAMLRGYDVVLIFSALNSHGFQAASYVTSYISVTPKAKRAEVHLAWVGDYSFLPFKSIDVENLNDNVKVTEAKDGQQIDAQDGFTLTGLLAGQSCSDCILQDMRDEKAVKMQSNDLAYSAFFERARCAQSLVSSNCSACGCDAARLMSGKGGIQYFPCKDLLCRSCIEKLSDEKLESSSRSHCPLCTYFLSAPPSAR